MGNDDTNANSTVPLINVFANVIHEIRTPISGLVGMLSLLEDTKLDNLQKEYISMIKECSYNLMTIINDILDYSKLNAGKLLLDYKSMNLKKCIESISDIINSKICEKKIEYTYNIDENISHHIICDKQRLKQVLLNLLSNAIKFTDNGIYKSKYIFR